MIKSANPINAGVWAWVPGMFSAKGCAGWFAAPTIFTDVTPDIALVRDGIFGLVLAVLPAKDDAHADRIGAGTVYLNTYFRSVPHALVGGFKQAGCGRESAIEGLWAYTQTKSVWGATDPVQAERCA